MAFEKPAGYNSSLPATHGTAPAKGGAPGRWQQSVPSDVLASLTDKDRICPVPAGLGLLDGDALKMRVPAGDLEITAPRRLLRKAFELCDGTQTWTELLAKLRPDKHDEFDQFIGFLLEQGAFTDAVLLTQKIAPYGFQRTAIGMNAPLALTHKIGERFVLVPPTQGRAASPGLIAAPDSSKPAPSHTVHKSPLDSLVDERVSLRTFSEKPVTETQLHSLLWSIAGVVQNHHPRLERASPRRTTGSGGGMYLVRWMLVLQKAVGSYKAGVYEIAYPSERQIQLVHRSDNTLLFHRAFARPWQQTFATGAVFAVAAGEIAALRYRNRALQYLMLEAGAGLQNFSLTAPKLGLAGSIIGGYAEEIVKELCGLGEELVLCSAIFGSHPTAAQQRAAERMLPVKFDWGDSSLEALPLPFFVARASVELEDGTEVKTWGTDPDPWTAYVKAHAEAVERQGMREPRDLVIGTMDEVRGAIDPRIIICYSNQQYRSAGFPFERFDSKTPYHWAKAIDVSTGKTARVNASFVYRWPNLLRVPGSTSQYTQANSSGCGAGPTFDFALLAATLEVIERDAFMRCWLTQTPGTAIPARLLPAATRMRVRNLQEAGCEVTLQALPAVAAHVAMVSVTHRDLKFTCVTAAGRLDLVRAVDAALNELELMAYGRLLDIKPTIVPVKEVLTPANHSALYAHHSHFRRAEGVLKPGQELQRLPKAARPQDAQGLLDVLITSGLKPVYVDMTPQQNRIDQGRTPLVVVKTIVPGLIPITFGYGREPRGMLQQIDKRSFFPHPFP